MAQRAHLVLAPQQLALERVLYAVLLQLLDQLRYLLPPARRGLGLGSGICALADVHELLDQLVSPLVHGSGGGLGAAQKAEEAGAGGHRALLRCSAVQRAGLGPVQELALHG